LLVQKKLTTVKGEKEILLKVARLDATPDDPAQQRERKRSGEGHLSAVGRGLLSLLLSAYFRENKKSQIRWGRKGGKEKRGKGRKGGVVRFVLSLGHVWPPATPGVAGRTEVQRGREQLKQGQPPRDLSSRFNSRSRGTSDGRRVGRASLILEKIPQAIRKVLISSCQRGGRPQQGEEGEEKKESSSKRA